ncbi:MAG: type II toxin-antitoxin system ParD family antitoxin [Burkholderiaceae bacterium]|nr:type II toxin-antitoxin system ParD family antitoxin [Burkholderiaceae bacterium]
MTMHVNLSPEMEVFIRNKVAGGFYGNATEVIRDAIRRMQAEEVRLAAWQAAIRVGDEQLDRGEGVPYSADALRDITQIALEAMHSGKPMDPDVLP